MALFIFIFLVIGILAGVYPASLMSSFSPIKTLKNNLRYGSEHAWLRKGLVIFQFTISIILIAGTILIYRQVDYLQNQKLGFDKDQILLLKMRSTISPKFQLIKSELAMNPAVISATATSFSYADGISNIAVLAEGADENGISSAPVISADYDFLKTFKIELVAGRDFSKGHPTDEGEGFIVNEAAVKYFGWGVADAAIGKKLDWGLGKKGKVIGVVRDFNFSSLHENIRPLIIHIYPEWYSSMALKINPADIPQTLLQLEETWKKLELDSPFDYSFLDQDFEKLYTAEQRTQKVISLLSFLAIFIACLGLLGLATFMAEQRTKEIGVRKVLGASVPGLIGLLSKDLLKLVLVSVMISIPIAWFALDKWLAGFAYKIEISWWIFGIAGGIAILIALLTVSFQSIKIALVNPINSLRSE